MEKGIVIIVPLVKCQWSFKVLLGCKTFRFICMLSLINFQCYMCIVGCRVLAWVNKVLSDTWKTERSKKTHGVGIVTLWTGPLLSFTVNNSFDSGTIWGRRTAFLDHVPGYLRPTGLKPIYRRQQGLDFIGTNVCCGLSDEMISWGKTSGHRALASQVFHLSASFLVLCVLVSVFLSFPNSFPCQITNVAWYEFFHAFLYCDAKMSFMLARLPVVAPKAALASLYQHEASRVRVLITGLLLSSGISGRHISGQACLICANTVWFFFSCTQYQPRSLLRAPYVAD